MCHDINEEQSFRANEQASAGLPVWDEGQGRRSGCAWWQAARGKARS